MKIILKIIFHQKLNSNILKKNFNQGVTHYDFGTASGNMIGNPNIFSFKEGFGAYGVFINTFRMELN